MFRYLKTSPLSWYQYLGLILGTQDSRTVFFSIIINPFPALCLLQVLYFFSMES